MNDDGSVEFTYSAEVSNNGYFAFGLSEASGMDATNVMFCFLDDSGAVVVAMGWNEGYDSFPLDGEELTAGLNLVEGEESFGSYEDGVLSCKFVRDAVTEISTPAGSLTLDLQNTDYYFLAAVGTMRDKPSFQIGDHTEKIV